MIIKAKVVNKFVEKEHENHVYNVGDIYPAMGFGTTEERIEVLSNIHPKYKKIYLADIVREEVEQDERDVTEFPKHLGGGTYELSNGEKIKGKEEAIKAEQTLNEVE